MTLVAADKHLGGSGSSSSRGLAEVSRVRTKDGNSIRLVFVSVEEHLWITANTTEGERLNWVTNTFVQHGGSSAAF